MKKEKNYFVIKTFVNLAIIIFGALIMFSVLRGIEYRSACTRQITSSNEVLDQVQEVIESNAKDAEELTELYHRNNLATLNDMKNLLTSGLYDDLASKDEAERTKQIAKIVEYSNIDYLFVMSEDSTVLLAPSDTYTGKNLVEVGRMYEENRVLLTDDDYTNFVTETNEDGSFYFYSVPVGDSFWLVYGTDSSVLDLEFASLKDISLVLKSASTNNDGFLFAVDENTGNFIYFNDGSKDLSGLNAKECGLSEKAMSNGYNGQEKIDGTDYFCVMRSCGNYLIVSAAVAIDSLYSNNVYSLAWSVFGFVLISMVCLIYAVIVRDEVEHDNRKDERVYFSKKPGAKVFYNRSIGKKVMPLMIAGVLLIFGISFYIQTLLQLSDAVAIADNTISEIENREQNLDDIRNDITDYYEDQFLSKAKLLAYFLEEDPGVLNVGNTHRHISYDDDGNRIPLNDSNGNPSLSARRSEGLQRYCEDNDIKSIYIFDDNGRTIATNNDEWYFEISNDPNDQSYPFKDVLDGRIDSYIQDKMIDEKGRISQYIGTTFNYYTTTVDGKTVYVSRHDYADYLEGNWKGSPVTAHTSLLQLGLNSDLMYRMISATDLASIVSTSNQRVILFDSSEDHVITYSFNQADVGKTAKEIGVSDQAFSGSYNGFQNINGDRFFQSVRFYEGSYISISTLRSTVYNSRFSVALTTSLCSFLFMAIMSALITISNDDEEEIITELRSSFPNLSNSTMFTILMPSGRESVTKKAEARWDNRHIPWADMTSEQKLGTLITYATGLAIIAILINISFHMNSLDNSSVIRYIVSGKWDHGFNIFALTGCALVIIVAIVGIKLASVPISLITSIFGTKSETIGHLILSVLKYGGAIAVVFYCLYLVGFDSGSLLASAGILSLVVGLGAQSLIKDIIAGIFIVFEGEFRVGDIVSIAGYRGQVLDIGLRTTKIMSDNQNIKIIANSDVSGVINMTRALSVLSVEVTVDFGAPIAEIEQILNSEMKGIFDRVEGIANGPYLKGVERFDQKTITLTVEAFCKEKDMAESKAKLLHELIDIFYRHGINIKK